MSSCCSWGKSEEMKWITRKQEDEKWDSFSNHINTKNFLFGSIIVHFLTALFLHVRILGQFCTELGFVVGGTERHRGREREHKSAFEWGLGGYKHLLVRGGWKRNHHPLSLLNWRNRCEVESVGQDLQSKQEGRNFYQDRKISHSESANYVIRRQHCLKTKERYTRPRWKKS